MTGSMCAQAKPSAGLLTPVVHLVCSRRNFVSKRQECAGEIVDQQHRQRQARPHRREWLEYGLERFLRDASARINHFEAAAPRRSKQDDGDYTLRLTSCRHAGAFHGSIAEQGSEEGCSSAPDPLLRRARR